MKRFLRFIEMGAVFGFLDKLTWRELFPPFPGWDDGCGYCALESNAAKRGHCERGEKMKYNKCGWA